MIYEYCIQQILASINPIKNHSTYRFNQILTLILINRSNTINPQIIGSQPLLTLYQLPPNPPAMKKLSTAILQPTVIAMGASIFLYAYNNNLPLTDYFLHLPFWIAVVRPSGMYWQSTVLKEVNKGVFPKEMKVYREMYVASKNAILYDVVLNHTIYHAMLTPMLITYMYLVKTMVDRKALVNKGKVKDSKQIKQANTKSITQQPSPTSRTLLTVLHHSLPTLIQGRVLISCFSILSEYAISYVSLKRQGSSSTSTLSLPTNVKRFLMAKEMLLSWSWSGLILKEFFRGYYGESEASIRH